MSETFGSPGGSLGCHDTGVIVCPGCSARFRSAGSGPCPESGLCPVCEFKRQADRFVLNELPQASEGGTVTHDGLVAFCEPVRIEAGPGDIYVHEEE